VKRHETRHWATVYRGPLVIHAAQKLATNLDDDLAELLIDEFGSGWVSELPRGRMLGTVRLADCRATEVIDPDTLDRLCGDWTPGRFAWRLEEPKLFTHAPRVIGRPPKTSTESAEARAAVSPIASSSRRRRRRRWTAAECSRSATLRLTRDSCIC